MRVARWRVWVGGLAGLLLAAGLVAAWRHGLTGCPGAAPGSPEPGLRAVAAGRPAAGPGGPLADAPRAFPGKPQVLQARGPASPARRQQARATAQEVLRRLVALERGAAGAAAGTALRGQPRGSGPLVPDPEQQAAVDALLRLLGADTRLDLDNVSGTLRCLRGDLGPLVAGSAAFAAARAAGDWGGMARAVAAEMQAVLRVQDTEREFRTGAVRQDGLGMTHVTLDQAYAGLPVWGAQIKVHFAADATPVEVSGVYTATPTQIRLPAASLPEDQALAAARAALEQTGADTLPPRLQTVVYWDVDRSPVVCWRVDLAPAVGEEWSVFVAAADGRLVHRYRRTCSEAVSVTARDLTGNDIPVSVWRQGTTYYAVDTTTASYEAGSGPPDFEATNGASFVYDIRHRNSETASVYPVTAQDAADLDPAAVSLLDHLHRTDAYFHTTHQRHSLDDAGLNAMAVIHVGRRYANAFWSDARQALFFGDGDGELFTPLARGLDVVAHEYTHGVVTYSCGLIYENQPGALSEHLADFFAAMVDREDWLVGEDVMVDAVCLRDMQDPGSANAYDPQPAHMDDYQSLPNTEAGDYGGVHVNSGIPNRLGCLLAASEQGVGRETAERLVYRAATVYLTARSRFLDYRRALESAARDLAGAESAEFAAVGYACDAVGIGSSSGGSGSTPGTPALGNETVIALVADEYRYSWRTDSPYVLATIDNQEAQLLASRYVAPTRPAVSGDGSRVLFVSATGNLWWTDGSSEQQLITDGSARTVAMSRDRRRIAFTTSDYDGIIWLLDLVTEEVLEVPLEVQQNDSGAVLLAFADVLTFNFRGDHLVFDAVSQIQVEGQHRPVSVWGIYDLRIADRALRQVVASTADRQVGNPAFGSTTDAILLADRWEPDATDATAATVALDLGTGGVTALRSGLPWLSQPTFRGDDSGLVVREGTADASLFSLLSFDVGLDPVTIDLDSQALLLERSVPIAFPLGYRQGDYEAQYGEIAVPGRVDLGTADLGDGTTGECTLVNTGNADLEVFSIAVVSGTPGAPPLPVFTVTGVPRVLRPAEELTVGVSFHPQAVGRVDATLAVGSTDPDVPSALIPLNGTGAAAVQLDLQPGWNLVSLPVEPTPADAAVLLAGEPRNGAADGVVWGRQADHFAAATQLHALTGYWVYRTVPARVRVPGTAPASTWISLEQEWVLVGVPATRVPFWSKHVRGDAWGWDAAAQRYAAATVLRPGAGYWLGLGDAGRLDLGPPPAGPKTE